MVDRPPYHLLASLLALGACSTDAVEAPPSPRVASAPAPAPLPRPSGARLLVPEGSFSSGTEPGRFERQPELEPRLTRTALGPFEIDAEPYPGGPAAPLLGIGRDEAAERCADRAGRLCTELEWERACKGPDSQPFPSGAELAPDCAGKPGCPSGFGAWGMGSLREWTASDLAGHGERATILRGATASAPAPGRRCAHREAAPSAPQPDIGFRCCYGPPNAARVVLPRQGAAFGKTELSLAELGQVLASEPLTERIAHELHYFEEPAASERVFGRTGRERQGVLSTTAPLAWNPVAGVELVVVTARSGPSTSFVVVLDALGDGTRRVASSFIMEQEPGPVVLAYAAASRARVQFSTCWGCAGETGKILYRDPDRAVIQQP